LAASTEGQVRWAAAMAGKSNCWAVAGTAQVRAGTAVATGTVPRPVGPEDAGPYPAAAGYSLAGDDGAGPVGPAEAGSYPAARSGVRPGYNLVGEGEVAATRAVGGLSHVGQVAALPSGPRLRDFVESKSQGFVIREECEDAAFQHESKMPDGLHTGEQFPVKRRVVDLGRR